jgi:hypothetical protein
MEDKSRLGQRFFTACKYLAEVLSSLGILCAGLGEDAYPHLDTNLD